MNVKIKTTNNVSVMKSRAALIAQMGGTTRVLNAELKKTIIQVKAVDTGRMRNTSDMSDQIFYYLYVDQGTINIRPRDITDKTLNKPNVQASLDKLYGKWIDYLTDRQFE